MTQTIYRKVAVVLLAKECQGPDGKYMAYLYFILTIVGGILAIFTEKKTRFKHAKITY